MPPKGADDYRKFLDPEGLKGARIGVVRKRLFGNSVETDRVAEAAIADMKAHGALIVDPTDIPTLGTFDDAELDVLLYEFKSDLNKYLAWLGPASPVHSLSDVIAFNNAFVAGGEKVGLKYGQDILLAAQALDTRADSSDTARYHADRARDIDLARSKGLDVMYQKYDAVLFPANRGAAIAARAGYPSIVVPGGFIANPAVSPPPSPPPTPFPAGFNAEPAPYGVTFSGPPFSEGKLIGYAYAFEQATHHRRAPAFAKSASLKL